MFTLGMLLIILILNVLTIFLMYKFLEDLNKKDKLIFIAVGVAIIYLITSLAYWISTVNMDQRYQDSTLKDMIVFLFVPINGLIILPILAKSYYKFKQGKLDLKILLKRGAILAIGVIIAVVLECVFMKDLQMTLFDVINQRTMERYEELVDSENIDNDVTNNVINDVMNEVTNEVQNEVSGEIINDVENNLKENNVGSNNIENEENEENEEVPVNTAEE